MEYSALIDYLDKSSIRYKSPVKTSDLVSFKVGGNGRLAVFPKSIDELMGIIELVKHEKYVILGKGTNCYFTDGMYDGVIIVTAEINKVCVYDCLIYAECGATVSSVCKSACEHSLTGMEFAYGIPGSIGGAVCMNASAFGGCFADIVLNSTVLDVKSGRIFEIDNAEHCFDTKKSVFSDGSLCLLATKILLKNGKKEEINEKMLEYIQRRKSTQPLDLPSAGSTFVKPEGTFASYLIDKAGLKGVCVGDAGVSNKHAGFIVNLGNATSHNVRALIDKIKNTVFEKYGVDLREEIIYIE